MQTLIGRYTFRIAGIIVIFIIGLFFINKYFLVGVPAYGGEIREGIIGTPRFINPVFAQSAADKDLTSLIYSGLMRDLGEELVPDLAKEYSVSDNGREYEFTIRESAVFHDGIKVKPEDIIFTVNTIQDFLIKSPYRTQWEGVEIEKVDSDTVVFKLKQPYSDFLHNTTVGILPSHLWQNVPPEQFGFSEYNIRPVGSGPFVFKSLKEDSSGIPVEYTLTGNKNFTLGRPFLEQIKVVFYPDEKSAVRGYEDKETTNIASLTPEETMDKLLKDKKTQTVIYPLSRVFGIFFNSNNNQLLRNEYIIEAIDLAINKSHVVDFVLHGYGEIANGPVPGIEENENNYDPDRAREILENNNWVLNKQSGIREKNLNSTNMPLSISLSTSNTPELKNTAELIKAYLIEIGVNLDTKIFEPGNLQQDIIRQRDYEALLFGQVIERKSDIYAFWHSSQRNDPGLNVSVYTNSKVDELLEKLRVETNKEKVNEFLQELDNIIKNEKPAVFLYSPSLIYITKDNLRGLNGTPIGSAEDRFQEVYKWFIRTERIWNFLL